jgi:polysaccharide export outer membrane protein
MKSFIRTFLVGFLVLGITSCTAYKKVPYVQVKSKAQEIVIPASVANENQIRFQPDDELSIEVASLGSVPLTVNFNMPRNNTTGANLYTYLVDKKGYIDFPILGPINVFGLTQKELEAHLKELLMTYLKEEPIVMVRLSNFNISVLGEFGRSGVISIKKDHVNLLEVIAMAGDMSINGLRDDIKLIRTLPDGSVKIVTLDISDANIISSPYFYLHQNDMIYALPSKGRAMAADAPLRSTLMSYFSTALTLGSFALMLFKL